MAKKVIKKKATKKVAKKSKPAKKVAKKAIKPAKNIPSVLKLQNTTTLIENTYSVYKNNKRMDGNLCVDNKGIVIGHLAELGSFCGKTILITKRSLIKKGYNVILN